MVFKITNITILIKYIVTDKGEIGLEKGTRISRQACNREGAFE